MRNCKRHRASSNKDIFKNTYNEILVSAKRKHSYSGEFYLFKTTIGNDLLYSESGVDVYDDSFEHWIKTNNKWEAVKQNGEQNKA